jgi:hypothetical protein
MNCATLGVIVVASCVLTAPAPAQTSPSDMWVPDQPEHFEHGWFWDPTAEAWKYGWYQPGNIAPPTYTREFTLAGSETRTVAAPMPTELPGTILTIQQRNISATAPPNVLVVVRTEDGTVRTIDLGNAQFVFQALPNLHQDQQILLRGSIQNVGGLDFFNPNQLVTSQSVLVIPAYTSNSRVRGKLINLYTVPGPGAFEKILVAQVRTLNNNLVDVVLGPTDQVGNRFYSLRPGTPFAAEGFVQRTPSGNMLYAQNVRVQEQLPLQAMPETPPTLVVNVQPSPPPQRLYPPPLPPAQVATTETIQGQIMGLHSAWIGGQSRLVADIETDNGNFVRADLGPRVTVDFLNLSPGDLITITGQRLFDGGQSLLVANQFAAHGQSINVQTTPQLVGAAETTVAPVQTFHGQVLAKRTETMPGYNEQRVVIDLRLDDGRVVPVDLGLKKCVKGIDLDRDDCITVWAQSGLVDGQPGLIAVQIQDKNKQVQLSRCD